jgi:hypothetical protein
MKVFIPTCDKYIHLLECVQLLTEVHFPLKDVEYHIIGYKEPKWKLNDNWFFHSIGEDRGANYFTLDLYNFFINVEDDIFMLFNDDVLFLKPCNLETYYKLLEEIKNDTNVGRIALTDDGTYRRTFHTKQIGYDVIKDYGLIEYKQNSDYKISTFCSLWRKDYLLKYLNVNYNPWQFEVLQSEKSVNDGARILATNRDFVIPSFSVLMRQGAINVNWFIDERGVNRLDEDLKNKLQKIING